MALLHCGTHLQLHAGGVLQSHRFDDCFYGGERHVVVYRPPGYSARDTRRYPVVYLMDGQNVFDIGHREVSWSVGNTAEHLISSGAIPPMILVGVFHTERRMDEYTPVRCEKYGGGGDADTHAHFLARELKPVIDAHYKTLRGPDNTAIVGSSLGGLFALHMGWAYPEVFGRVGAMSPSLWWGNRAIFRQARSWGRGPSRLWIDMGTNEVPPGGGAPVGIPDLRAMRDILLAKGYRLGRDLHYHEVVGAPHNEWAWGQRIGDVLETLFRPAEAPAWKIAA